MARRRPAGRAEPAELEPEGTLICEGFIAGRPTPWKAPTLGRNGGTVRTRDYKTYKAWQEWVALQAKLLMGRRRPYGGPVALSARFVLAPRPGKPPDRSNLLKSFEDALEGIVIRNDTQIIDGPTTRAITDTEPQGVRFRVVAAGR